MDSKYFDYSCEAQANAELRRREVAGDTPVATPAASMDAAAAALRAGLYGIERLRAELKRVAGERDEARKDYAKLFHAAFRVVNAPASCHPNTQLAKAITELASAMVDLIVPPQRSAALASSPTHAPDDATRLRTAIGVLRDWCEQESATADEKYQMSEQSYHCARRDAFHEVWEKLSELL